jgi:hypothetical protein
MKKILHLLMTAVMYVVTYQSSFAQCEFLNPGVELNNVSTSGANCMVSMNLRFTIDRNNGNKFTYIHLWKATQHPTIGYGNSDKGPTAAQLNQIGPVLATIAIEWTGANQAKLINSYSPDPTLISPLFTGVSISQTNSGNLYTVTISNLSFPIPGACSEIPPLKGDVWGTQSDASKPAIHCGNSGFNLVVNDPLVSGNINCNGPSGPRTYNLDVTTTNLTALNVVYKLYLDDGVLTGGLTNFTSADQLIFTSPSTPLSAGTPIDINAASYTYGSGQGQRTLWVEVSSPDLPNSIIAELNNNCDSPLPVKLVKFKADLLDHIVGLSWTTADESNSLRFHIERSNNGREFIAIGSVAAKGNSNSTTNYSFVDNEPNEGINYYRLKQVDLDGTYTRSQIISIKNDSQEISFELLGNPVENGIVKFILTNSDPANVRLINPSGIDQTFNFVKEGNVFYLKPTSKLPSGLYLLSLKMTDQIRTKKVLIP